MRKNKMIKKISALLIALVLCLSFFGCSGSDAPEGMKDVTVDGEPFKLYVPEAWTDNRSSGISSAYYSSRDNILVTARYFTPASELTLDDYIASLEAGYAQTLVEFAKMSLEDCVLSTENAKQLIYTAKIGEVGFTYRQIIALYKGDVVLLTFLCPTARFEEMNAEFTSIADAFVLREKAQKSDEGFPDKKTPEGMKLASADNMQYKFYVPTSWKCDIDNSVSDAYYPESEKSNVVVTATSLDSEMTVEQYFALCEKEYKDTFGEGKYEFIGKADRTVAERDATSFTYTVTVGDTRITVRQTMFLYNQGELVYSITYTAHSDRFDEHVADVDKMLDHFEFR